MKFGIEKSVEIFKELATTPGYEVGCKFGFDKVYKNKKAVSNAIYRLFTEIKNDPKKFVFTNEGGTNYLLHDHPAYRTRILTIYEAFEKNLTQDEVNKSSES